MIEGTADPTRRVRTGGIGPPAERGTRRQVRKDQDAFREVLSRQMNDSVSVSKHARLRMERDGIQLDHGRDQRLRSAVSRAADRGSETSLVIMDDLAMVVNVRNRTLITVVSGDRQNDGVFTDIDSAVMAD